MAGGDINTSCLSKNKTDLGQFQDFSFETRLVNHNLFCLKQGQLSIVKKLSQNWTRQIFFQNIF